MTIDPDAKIEYSSSSDDEMPSFIPREVQAANNIFSELFHEQLGPDDFFTSKMGFEVDPYSPGAGSSPVKSCTSPTSAFFYNIQMTLGSPLGVFSTNEDEGSETEPVEVQLSPADSNLSSPTASPQYSPHKKKPNNPEDSYDDPYRTPSPRPVRSKRQLDYGEYSCSKRQKRGSTHEENYSKVIESYLQQLGTYSIFDDASEVKVATIVKGYQKLLVSCEAEENARAYIISNLLKNERFNTLLYENAALGIVCTPSLSILLNDILSWINLPNPITRGEAQSSSKVLSPCFFTDTLLKVRVLVNLLKSVVSTDIRNRDPELFLLLISKLAYKLAFVNEYCKSKSLQKFLQSELSTLYESPFFYSFLCNLATSPSIEGDGVLECFFAIILSGERGAEIAWKLFSEAKSQDKLVVAIFRYVQFQCSPNSYFPDQRYHLLLKNIFEKIAESNAGLLVAATEASPFLAVTTLAEVGYSAKEPESVSSMQKVVGEVISEVSENIELELCLVRLAGNQPIQSALSIGLQLFGENENLWISFISGLGVNFIVNSIHSQYFVSIPSVAKFELLLLKCWFEHLKEGANDWVDIIQGYSKDCHEIRESAFTKLITRELVDYLQNTAVDVKDSAFNAENYLVFINSLMQMDAHRRSIFIESIIGSISEIENADAILFSIFTSNVPKSYLSELWMKMSKESRAHLLSNLHSSCTDLTDFVNTVIPTINDQYVQNFKKALHHCDIEAEDFISKILNRSKEPGLEYLKSKLLEL